MGGAWIRGFVFAALAGVVLCADLFRLRTVAFVYAADTAVRAADVVGSAVLCGALVAVFAVNSVFFFLFAAAVCSAVVCRLTTEVVIEAVFFAFAVDIADMASGTLVAIVATG